MPWYADEAFWRDCFAFMFPAERFAAAEEQVNQILKLTAFEGRTVLDLCCGPGRHSVAFAQRGYQVTGVDLSPFLLDHARRRASEASVEIEFIHEDMRRFKRSASFDLACSLFTSFGYFEDPEDDLEVLRNVRRGLTPEGVFVIDLIGKETLARIWQNAICTETSDGWLMLQRPEVLADWTRLRNEWVLVKDGAARSFRFEHTIYSGRELKDRLMQAGFDRVALYGSLEGAPYGLEARRLIAVAHA